VRADALFDEAASEYDCSRRRLVPGFDEFYSAVAAAIPHGLEEEIRILDLGAGTGLLSAMVADKFPRSRVTLVDISVQMLRVARRRFMDEPGRFEYRVMDYARKPLPKAVPGGGRSYDIVISALSIHHLTHGDKRELFEKIHHALTEGGVFVNADQVLGETPEVERTYQDWWLERVREAGSDESELAAALERIRADKNATLKAQLAWMEEVGFEEIECNYEDHRFAVYNGRKPVDRDVYRGKEGMNE